MTADPVLRSTRAGDGGRILVLTLARAGALNAIDNALLGALHAALDEVDAQLAGDPLAVRAVVIAGEGGRAFSTGMDLKERATFDDEALRAQRHEIVRLVTRIHELPVPAIAAVEGFALAGGFELALACDLVVASRDAVFGLPEVGVGVFPGGGGTQTLTWAVGPARARDVVLTGRRLTADEAEQWGIVARVVEPGTASEAAIALAERVAAGAPIAVRQARRAIATAHRSLAEGVAGENALYEDVLVSADRREGFAAFAAKRAPRFEGR
ncbi:MAG TPA: enoyl-CoA hydratase-related protein [Candidatus Limnocylindrales bacterium]|nr:enoyl-CoA hydratase-related protein [Candidatus Limnocylindrales bacterium]